MRTLRVRRADTFQVPPLPVTIHAASFRHGFSDAGARLEMTHALVRFKRGPGALALTMSKCSRPIPAHINVHTRSPTSSLRPGFLCNLSVARQITSRLSRDCRIDASPHRT